MKKILLILLLSSGFLKAQIVNIPDAYFKAKLISLGIDTNNDGYIQLTEAQAVNYLSVNESNIVSMEGIKSFTNLVQLECYYNFGLTSLDVSNLTNLVYLDTRGCALSTLNVSGCTNLQVLTCWQNNLTTLDISSLGALQELMCDSNELTSITGNGLLNLWKFHFSDNPISSVDLSNMPALKFLNCRQTPISSLDLAVAPTIEELLFDDTDISSIDLSPLPNLKTVWCYNTPLATLDITNNPQMMYLMAYNTNITELDLANQHNLVELDVSHTGISELNTSDLESLRIIMVNDTQLSHFDLTNSPQVYNTNMHNCPLLETVFLKNGGSTELTSLTFYNSPQLHYVCCNDNNFAFVHDRLQMDGNPSCVVNSYCSFTPGGDYNSITGIVGFDDGSGCSASGIVANGIRIGMTGPGGPATGIINGNGEYAFYTEAGSFTMTPQLENSAWFNITPPNATVSFPDDDNHNVTSNFCLTAIGVHSDVEIVIIPVVLARPGFDSVYDIIYKNKGNQALSGSVNFNFDDAILDYVSATVAPDVQITDNLTWNYTNLLPFESRTVRVTLNLNSPVETPAVNIDDVLNLTATANPVSGDETPEDNTFGLKQTVVGSFDPNDKSCLQGNIVSPTQIGEYLFYVINFENTGNFPAENVVIKDLIDIDKFDISSVQILGASHQDEVTITGSKLEIFFHNINLVPNEYGYVAFKIRTKNNLATGATVTNKANIYFDFNAPVTTNTASTTFQSLSVGENPVNASVRVFPNPANHIVNVESGAAIQSVCIFDVQGRIMATKQVNQNNFAHDISAYVPGIYYLKISTDKGSVTQKLIKE